MQNVSLKETQARNSPQTIFSAVNKIEFYYAVHSAMLLLATGCQTLPQKVHHIRHMLDLNNKIHTHID